jgi:uncharacterized protein YecE (DUF72 family)
VPAGFRFCAKVPKIISHGGLLRDADAAFSSFVDEVAHLGSRLGPLLLQLPPKLAFEEDAAHDFFRMARRVYQGPMAIEPRHASWFGADVDELLDSFGIARVAADPQRGTDDLAPGGHRDLTYLRLHGSPRVYFSAYEDRFLDAVSALAKQSQGTVWCIFDNTASGNATGDALKMSRRLSALR